MAASSKGGRSWRGRGVRTTTPLSTLGRGTKMSGGSLRTMAAFQRSWVRTLRSPQSGVPGAAQRRSQTSFWSVKTARWTGLGLASQRRTISVPTE